MKVYSGTSVQIIAYHSSSGAGALEVGDAALVTLSSGG